MLAEGDHGDIVMIREQVEQALSKISGDDTMTIDLLVGNEPSHEEVIKRAIVDNSERGIVRIARKEDLIWLKKFRNSKQDIADIEALENDTD